MCRHLNPALLLLCTLIGCGGGGTGPSDAGGASGDPTPPTAPTDLTASPVSAGDIGLAWSASTDATGVAGYKVYEGSAEIGAAASTSFAVTGLAAGSSHCYTVKARDAAGNLSSPSNQACATSRAPLAPPLVLTTKKLPPATAGAPYSAALAASGDGPFAWNATTIAPDVFGTSVNHLSIGTSSGALGGTPTYAGTQPIFLTLTGADGSVGIEEDLVIGGSGSSQNITNAPVPATQGSSYQFQFTTSWTSSLGCSADMTLVFGSIPPGLSFNPLQGSFSGTPTLAGRYTMTLSADPGSTLCGPAGTNFKTFTLAVNPATSPATPPGSSQWSRQGTAPVLAPSPAAADWDGFFVGAPSVVKVGSTFTLAYEGQSGSTYRYAIGFASSGDGLAWTKGAANPVLSAGAAGSWDEGGVRYPVLHYDGALYRMWYQGTGTGGTAIGLATSPDGITWTKSASNPVIAAKGLVSAYAPGAVVKTANQFVLYYSADGNIGRATSSDGVAWSDQGTVFAPDSVRYARPAVVLDGATWRMWITRIEGVGSGIANPSAVYPITVGYADSPDGITWSTYGNPVLTAGAEGAWDRPCVGGPAVVKDGAAFRMWYAGGRGNLPGQLWDANPFVEGAIGYAVAP
jgi:hypothetical protein